MNPRPIIVALAVVLGLASASYGRWYDAETGRFQNRDRAGYVDGPNMYQYVRSQPITQRDPMGLCGTGSGTSLAIAYATPCVLDTEDAGCKKHCEQSYGNYGWTNCVDGLPKCCICSENIKNAYPDGAPIVNPCMTAAEEVAYQEPWLCDDNWEDWMSPCGECDRDMAELSCLISKLNACYSLPYPGNCVADVMQRIHDLEDNENCRVCQQLNPRHVIPGLRIRWRTFGGLSDAHKRTV